MDKLQAEGLIEELSPGLIQATATDRGPSWQPSNLNYRASWQPTEAIAETELAEASDFVPLLSPSDPVPVEHYWLMIRSVRLGDTLEDLATRNPDLTSAQDKQLGLELTGLTNGRGLTVLAFRGIVYSINVSFVWEMTLEDLITAAAPYFCTPGATPVDESLNLSGWLNGDEVFLANVRDGIASVVLGTFSIMNEVTDLLEALDKGR